MNSGATFFFGLLFVIGGVGLTALVAWWLAGWHDRVARRRFELEYRTDLGHCVVCGKLNSRVTSLFCSHACETRHHDEPYLFAGMDSGEPISQPTKKDT